MRARWKHGGGTAGARWRHGGRTVEARRGHGGSPRNGQQQAQAGPRVSRGHQAVLSHPMRTTAIAAAGRSCGPPRTDPRLIRTY